MAVNIKNSFPNYNGMNLNPGMFNPPPNIYNMNPNFSMNNQINLNQNLRNLIPMNPNNFGFNTNIQNQNNAGQFQPFGGGNNMTSQGNLPRRNIPNIDCYPWYNGPRINVIFEVSTGIKINIPAPPIETVEGLLNKFCERVGINKNLLKKEIICIYNANFINPTRKDSIQYFFQQNMGLNDQAKIVVIDAQNIIGA